MSEIKIDTDAVVAAVVATLDLSGMTMVIHDAIRSEVSRLVAAEIKDTLKDTVRAAVAEAMPAFTETLSAHIGTQMKVRQRRFEKKMARVMEE